MFLHNAHQFSSNPITLTVNQVSLHSPIRTQGGTLWLRGNLFDLPGTHVAQIFIEERNPHFWTTRNLPWKCPRLPRKVQNEDEKSMVDVTIVVDSVRVLLRIRAQERLSKICFRNLRGKRVQVQCWRIAVHQWNSH